MQRSEVSRPGSHSELEGTEGRSPVPPVPGQRCSLSAVTLAIWAEGSYRTWSRSYGVESAGLAVQGAATPLLVSFSALGTQCDLGETA